MILANLILLQFNLKFSLNSSTSLEIDRGLIYPINFDDLLNLLYTRIQLKDP